MLSNHRINDDFFAEWRSPHEIQLSIDPLKLSRTAELEIEKNKMLELQVSSLQSLVDELRSEINQYHNEAIAGEDRIVKLEHQLSALKASSSSRVLSEDVIESSLALVDSNSGFYSGDLNEESAFALVENSMLRGTTSIQTFPVTNERQGFTASFESNPDELGHVLCDNARLRSITA